jgi:hypothetical protein
MSLRMAAGSSLGVRNWAVSNAAATSSFQATIASQTRRT